MSSADQPILRLDSNRRRGTRISIRRRRRWCSGCRHHVAVQVVENRNIGSGIGVSIFRQFVGLGLIKVSGDQSGHRIKNPTEVIARISPRACRYPRTHTDVSAYGRMSDVFPLSAVAVPLNESLANRAVIYKPRSHDAFMVYEVMRRKLDGVLAPGAWWIRAVGMRSQSEER